MARITRAKSAIQLDKGDLAQLNKELFEMLDTITSLTKRREIVEPAGQIVKEEARRLTPKSEKVHYRYRTPKLTGKLKAPPGKGIKVAAYIPGNLRKSIVDLAERRKKYRTYRVVIGPFYRSFRSLLKSGVYGKTDRTADGFYAHMIYGSSKAFRREVTGRALLNKKSQVIQIIRSGVIREIVDQKKRAQKIN